MFSSLSFLSFGQYGYCHLIFHCNVRTLEKPDACYFHLTCFLNYISDPNKQYYGQPAPPPGYPPQAPYNPAYPPVQPQAPPAYTGFVAPPGVPPYNQGPTPPQTNMYGGTGVYPEDPLQGDLAFSDQTIRRGFIRYITKLKLLILCLLNCYCNWPTVTISGKSTAF